MITVNNSHDNNNSTVLATTTSAVSLVKFNQHLDKLLDLRETKTFLNLELSQKTNEIKTVKNRKNRKCEFDLICILVFYIFSFCVNNKTHIDYGHPPMKSVWRIERNVGGCKWSTQLYAVVVCPWFIAAKISITQPYEREIAIVFFWTNYIVVCWKCLMKSKRECSKKKQKTASICNWIHRSHGISIDEKEIILQKKL